jgi:DNA polymerase III delta prime subunit
MKLLTKIIGPAPSELDPEALMILIRQNRARMRREIKEYRRLRAAIKAESPKRSAGRPTKISAQVSKQKQMELANLVSEANVTMEEVLAEIRAMKEKKNV